MSARGGGAKTATVAGDGRSAARATRSRGAPSRYTASSYGRGGGDDPTVHPTLSRELCREALALYDSAAVDLPRVGKVLGVKQLKGVLRDMGIDWPENQVKDLIFRVRQTASVEKRNEAADRAEQERLDNEADVGTSAGLAAVGGRLIALPTGDGPLTPSVGAFGKDGRSDAPESIAPQTELASVAATAVTATSGGADKDEKAYLDRRLFLEVLTLTLDDCDEEAELRAAWELLDKDGDGVLSVADLASVLQHELGERVGFAEAREGMAVTMTPEGCAPGKEFYSGVVLRKDADRAVIRWADAANGGPPPRCSIARERAERREWWDTGARPTRGAPRRAEELRESLHQADFDNDGLVKFRDFCKAMDTN